MLMIRLLRVGRKHDPSFRVVVTDKRNSAQSRKFKEILGHYDARTDKAKFLAERVSYWLSVGAQPSGTIHNLLVDAKIISAKKKNILPKRKTSKTHTPSLTVASKETTTKTETEETGKTASSTEATV